MKIHLAASAGFCFGVKRAIDIAYNTLRKNKNVYILGDIVHNEAVAKKLEKAGIKKIKGPEPGNNKIFLIRAHGVGLKSINKYKKLGYKIVDATCPMVKEIHTIAVDAERNGFTVIIIGDKKHDEVRGIVGRLKKRAIVIEDKKRIPWNRIGKIKKARVVTQSTQNMEKVMSIVAALKSRIKRLEFVNTICRPTRIKQEEIKKMPRENDLMIIIGSKTSANTKRLYEISKSLNKKSYWVQTKKDIDPRWLQGMRSIGITAGASTPETTTKDIIACLKKIAS